MPETVEVRFKGNRKGLYEFTDPQPLALHEAVVVQSDRGQDLGRVSAVGETALSLESQMILLATAVSGSPFLGLLGTVWGVMDAFTGVAEAGSPNLVAMAPGVSGALITTVVALCVAIPAMFGYNFLVTSIRGIIVEMDNFAAELASEFEHKYVDHGSRESAFRR